MYAIAGVLRAGAGRAGHHSPKVFGSIAGSHRRNDVRRGSMRVSSLLNDTPDRCSMVVSGFVPSKGDEVIVTLGTINRLSKLFGGHVLTVTQVYESKPENVAYHLACTDYTWQFNRRQVTKRYLSTSVTDIAIDLVETYAPGFSSAGIALGLDTIEEITFTQTDLADCFSQLANRIGGYWKIDYNRRVHLWLTSSLQAPTTLIAAPSARFRNLQFTEDLSQVITRVYGEGGGANALQQIDLGETIIPVETAEWYNPSGGTFKSGPQIITYAGRSLGGGGGLVGPGAAPSSAPGLALAGGSGVESGIHSYAVTFVTAAGESIAGPLATITVGTIAAPSTAPTVGTPTSGGSVTTGVHDYEVTFVTSGGETTPSPVSGQVTTGAAGGVVTPPASAPIANPITDSAFATTSWAVGDQVYFQVVYVNASGATTPGPSSNTVTAEASATPSLAMPIGLTSIPVSGDGSVTGKRVYFNVNGVWVGYSNFAAGVTSDAMYPFGDTVIAGSPPVSNTAVTSTKNTVPLTNIPTGPPATTSRKLYRRFNGSGTFKLVTTIANNSATTYTDTTANGSLGADAPSSNTATANQVSLSAIPIGGTGVTSRKVYRTAAGGSQLKLQSTIGDNTTTTATDSTADGSLGVNVPTSDTSGLSQPEGQIGAGSTSIIATGLNAFSATGGWAVTGNGQQVIRYTGISATALTGVPSSGPGAIVSSIAYNSAITAAPELTGIPASGAGSLQYGILRGDPINIWVQRDDAAAQAALAALIGNGFDGISEDNIQDRRLSEDEVIARCDALLEQRKDARAELRYDTYDVTTQSGADITVNIGAPTNIVGTFTIQTDTISDIEITPTETPRSYPLHHVEASTEHFTLEDLLRQRRAA